MRRPARESLTQSLLRIAWILLLIPASSCTVQEEPGTTAATSIDLNSLPENRVRRDRDWRDTRLLPPGAHAISLGEIRQGAVVRIGFAPQGVVTNEVSATVLAGDTPIEHLSTQDPTTWLDAVVPLDDRAPNGTPVRVVFDSDTAIRIARCDMTAPQQERPNVLIFLVDTMRRDHLSCYGYPRETSPNFDRLAEDGVKFDHMVAQSSWTRPSVASLLTATYPSVHGARDRSNVVREDLTTLAEAFRDDGYHTEAFMTNPNCMPIWGFDKGFTRFKAVNCANAEGEEDRRAADDVLEALEALYGDPWFLYVHAIGPHNPYDIHDVQFSGVPPGHPNETPERQADINNYDGEIHYTDQQFGRIVEALRENGVYDDTIIIVVSDHGEQFWEHGGWGHGHTLFDYEVLVPMIIKLPASESAGTTAKGIAELVDIGPTLLELADIEPPESFQGRSLTQQIAGQYSDTQMAYMSLNLRKYDKIGARSLGAKYVRDNGNDTTDWYDLQADPREQNPLSAAPFGGEQLARFASRICTTGGEGLYVMVTGSLLEEHTFRGTITGTGLGETFLHYEARNAEVNGTSERIDFRITTSVGEGAPLDLATWHEDAAEQNHALLKIQVDPNQPVRISITLDGEVAPAEYVFVGADQSPTQLNDTPIEPLTIAGNSEAYSPIRLPRKLAAYLWYVPSVETIEDEALDPAILEELRALGYQ